jgi:integrase
LGYYPTIAAAREAARKLIERVEAGAPIPPPAAHPRAALTIGGLIDNYEKLRIKEGTRIKALPDAMASLRRNLGPWLATPAAQFTKADLRAARDGADKRSGMIAANRFLGYFGPVLKWAAQEDLVPANFVGDVRRSPESKRTRKLTDAEIVAIWKACDAIGTREPARNYGRLVRFALICAQRRDECASLRHGDIIAGRWKQEQNKASRPHTLALPPLALSLVGPGTAQEYVFAGRSGKLSGYSKMKAELDRVPGVTGWVLHDLRRSAASRMQALGIPPHVISGVLNHAIVGVGGVYMQDEMEKQKAEALATWAVALAKIVRPVALVAS